MERSLRKPQQATYVESDNSDTNQLKSPEVSLFDTPTNSHTKSVHVDEESDDELMNDTIVVASKPAVSGRSLPARSTRSQVNYARPKRPSTTPKQGRKRKAEPVINSDMILETQTRPSKKPAPIKPDSARNRVREDIATHTKAKRDNFLVHHRDYFLPVLPANNYVSKLVQAKTNGEEEIVPNRQLTEQPIK